MPDCGLEGASSILAEIVSTLFYFFVFNFFFVSMYVSNQDTTDSKQHMSIAGCVLHQLAITLYIPAARQQSRKQHHACAVVCPRCIAVAPYE